VGLQEGEQRELALPSRPLPSDLRRHRTLGSGRAAEGARAARDDPLRLAIEFHAWHGPAGIGDRYFAEHKEHPDMRPKMVTYQLGLLKRGPKWAEEVTPARENVHAAHLANISRLLAAGKLVAAGPFTDEGDLRGVFVFRADSTEARRLALGDPAVKAGRLTVELHPWMAAEGVFPTK
jgi:uncharacterized protein YciI